LRSVSNVRQLTLDVGCLQAAVAAAGPSLKRKPSDGGATGAASYHTPYGVAVLGEYREAYEVVLTPQALEFVADLSRLFTRK
jgi:hypothetical protein